jgi:hypothetical protein
VSHLVEEFVLGLLETESYSLGWLSFYMVHVSNCKSFLDFMETISLIVFVENTVIILLSGVSGTLWDLSLLEVLIIHLDKIEIYLIY